jgi:two-component system, OmpR family, sensor kinase
LHLRPRTLRWKLTFLYAALLAIVLAALGAYTYVSLRSSLISVRVSTLADDVNVGRALFARAAPITRAQAPVRLATFVAIASGESAGVIVWTNDSGQPAAQVAGSYGDVQKLPRLDDQHVYQALTGQETSPQVIDNVVGSSLVVAFPGITRAHALGEVAIEVAVPMKPTTDVLDRMLTLFVLGSIGALAVTAVGGALLMRRSLQPLHRLAGTAGRLAGGDLTARANVAANDEVGTLGTAFDDMASRIEGLFAAQQEQEHQVRRFIADASHELRTPITALKGYIDIMHRGAGRDPASLDAILDSMGREAERMRKLILDLLMLARLDARTPTAANTFELKSVVNQVLDDGVPGMPSALTRDFPSEDVVVLTDRDSVETVLRNLLVNACKYAPGAAQTWAIQPQTDSVDVVVVDQGPGISAEDLPHVFERFYRGEKTRTREEGGSGLGLAIAKGLVESQGGQITIASTEGNGTTAKVTLRKA